MSGGHYDYAYLKIQEIKIEGGQPTTERRLKFQKLLNLVADAMHDIEWVDSGDKSPGDENKAIDKVFNFLRRVK